MGAVEEWGRLQVVWQYPGPPILEWEIFIRKIGFSISSNILGEIFLVKTSFYFEENIKMTLWYQHTKFTQILSFLAFRFWKQMWFKVLLNWYFLAKTQNCGHFLLNFDGTTGRGIQIVPPYCSKWGTIWVPRPVRYTQEYRYNTFSLSRPIKNDNTNIYK